jgi:hypothetical protein
LHCDAQYLILEVWFKFFDIPISEETRFMARMKTLMADDDEPEPEPGTPQDGAPVPAPVRAGDPGPGHDLLRELARPCDEPLVRTDSAAPYVGFASSKAATWDRLRQLYPKIPEGAPFLGMPGGQFELPGQFKFNLACFKQFWSARNDQYQHERVEFNDPGRHSALDEEFLAVVVVHLGQQLVPAVGFFGRTKAGAVRKSAESLLVAGTSRWAGLSPAHAASVNFPYPFGQFVTTVTMEPRTARATGRQYQLAIGHVRPANLEELDVLTRAINDDDFMGHLDVAMKVFKSRLQDLEGIARGGTAA